jgi:hypothetical protein
MVNFDMWMGVFGGEQASCRVGPYRFRTERVYLPPRPVRMKKCSTNERVKVAELEPAALLRTAGPHP